MTFWLHLGSNFFPVLPDSLSLVLLSILLVLLVFIWNNKKKEKKLNLPPGPYGLPIVGSLPFLGKSPPETLFRYAEKYGKIFSLKYGKTPVIIVADIDNFREVCSKTELLNRPTGIFDIMPGSGGFSGSNGNHWVEQRRFTMKSVRNLGLGKSPWEVSIADEIEEFIKLLQNQGGRPIDVEGPLSCSVLKNVLSLVLSKQIDESSPDFKMIMQFLDSGMKIVGANMFTYHFPRFIQKTLMRFFSISKRDLEVVDEFDNFLSNAVSERKEASTYFDSGDFIGSYLEEIQKKNDVGEKEDSTFKEYSLIGNMTSMLVGGSETSKTSIQWLFVAMVQHPEIQQKVYEELESFLGEKRLPQWEDRSKLPWTFTTIMEAQRWRTLAPLSPARMASEDIQIGGYDIPKGANVEGLLYAIHNDKRYWKNPEKFNPSRFLKDDGTINFKLESYVPFSTGRRNCPGETIALMEILIYFSAVVRNFEIKSETPGKEFYVEGIFGQTYQPAPHKLRFIPRQMSDNKVDATHL